MKVSGVLAWHPAVAMTKEEIDEFLSGRWVARLATRVPAHRAALVLLGRGVRVLRPDHQAPVVQEPAT